MTNNDDLALKLEQVAEFSLGCHSMSIIHGKPPSKAVLNKISG